MKNKRYAALFESLKEKREGAFIPFVTLGDPEPEMSFLIIRTLVDSGADALELGFPFSDPVADGPTIQKASIRALNARVGIDTCFEIISRTRQNYPDLPIGLLLYANLIVHRGVDAFYARAAQCGVDSILVADIPLLEADLVREAARKNNIAQVFIAAPNADEYTLKKIAQVSSAYTYLLSRSGVTGTENSAGIPAETLIKKLNDAGAPPPVLGFGISKPEHVRQALAHGARGVFTGSAIVRIIEAENKNPEKMLSELSAYVKTMKQAAKF